MTVSRKLIITVAAVVTLAAGLFWSGDMAVDEGLVS